jgi:NodT family efflux transporter outer membrane factor (OMF) lipoprotein
MRLAVLAVLAASLTAAGCVVGPDFRKPRPPAASGYAPQPLPQTTVSTPVAGGQAQRFARDLDIAGQWWTLFHSHALNELIEQALVNNPDLQSAQASLRVANENVRAQVGAYYPTIGAGFSASRNNGAVQISPTLASSALLYNLYTAQISAAWTLDIWGGNQRAVESLQATADATRDQLEAAYLTLTSALAGAAIQEASLRAQIAATYDLITINTRMVQILRSQRNAGYADGLDVAAQESQLAQVEATLAPLQKQLAQQRDLIAALAGKMPSDTIAQTFQLSGIQLPVELPVSLPAKLVDQRPDIRAAAEALHAASAQIGVAIANRLPNLTISASYGSTATQISQLLAPGNGFWSIAGGVTQTIFDGGTLLHRERGARAMYDQAEAQYRSTVISALQNVADSLHALESDADALKSAAEAERAAKVTLDLTTAQESTGYVNYLTLLSAEQAYQQAVINLVLAQANRYADTAALFQALGGGWWNRHDVPVETADDKLRDLFSGP